MLNTLNSYFPIRYIVFGLCVFGLLLSVLSWVVLGLGGMFFLVFAALVGTGGYGLGQNPPFSLRN